MIKGQGTFENKEIDTLISDGIRDGLLERDSEGKIHITKKGYRISRRPHDLPGKSNVEDLYATIPTALFEGFWLLLKVMHATDQDPRLWIARYFRDVEMPIVRGVRILNAFTQLMQQIDEEGDKCEA